MEKGELEEANSYFIKALGFHPTSRSVLQNLEIVRKAIVKRKEAERDNPVNN